MIFISKYKLLKRKEIEFCCKSLETPACPCCGNELRYRDQRKRIMRSYNGMVYWLWLRRLFCSFCHSLHLELPDILVPNKHYASEVVENVIDGVSTEDDKTTEDYPCRDTMARWKAWLEAHREQFEISLRASRCHQTGMGMPLLQELRTFGSGWLSICIRALLNRFAPVLHGKGNPL